MLEFSFDFGYWENSIIIFLQKTQRSLMSHDSTSLPQRLLQSLNARQLHSDLGRIESPQFFYKISQDKKVNYPSQTYEKTQLNIEQLLRSNRGPSIRKINDDREKYRQIKLKITDCMQQIHVSKELTLGEILQWKQTVLATFYNEFLIEISKQCKEKSEILAYIWNSLFNLIDYLLETISKMKQKDEKQYLQSLLNNHASYQSVIDSLKAKLNKKQEQRKRQEEFIKVLVYNLRYKRKQIKKLTKNLRICTFKLNEFKDFYLDLQLQHIELLSENREISKQNAKNLLKRKQQINHEKRIQYKLKQSKKRIRFHIQNQIQNQNNKQGQNVNKLNDELQTAFNKCYSDKSKTQQPKTIESIVQNLFENALDDFTVRIDDIPQTQTLLDFKNNVGFMDVATDMTDFVREVQQREIQTTNNDKLFYDMICHASMQTVQFKAKVKIFEEVGIQIEDNQLKALKLSRVKVIDKSYILEDYRDKDRRLRLERNIALKTKTEQYLKSMKEIHYYDNNQKTIQLIDYQLQSDQQFKKNSVKVQTKDAFYYNFERIPQKYRRNELQREITKYFQLANRYAIDSSDQRDESVDLFNKTAPIPNFKSKSLKSILKKGKKNSVFLQTQNRSNENSFYDSSNPTNRLSSRLSTSRTRASKDIRNTSLLKKVRGLESAAEMSSIKESKFQELGSKQRETNHLIYSSIHTVATLDKFWVAKENVEEISKDKRMFLNHLNLSDKLLSRLHGQIQCSNENKRILVELQKMSSELFSNKALFDLLQNNINQNMHILKQQLRKMLMKKRTNRKLALSRQKSLTKIISLVYTYAYHLYYNHDKALVNLIIPLFHYFKIGYGQIKKNDLYLRMLYFLSQTICHKDEYYIFQTFILFLGLDLQETNKIKISTQTTGLYLKLLSSLSLNFKYPLNVEQLYTTFGHLDKKCREILIQEKYQLGIIDKVIERVKVKLTSLLGDGENQRNFYESEYNDVKINVFKCCQFIIEQLQKIKTTVYESYVHLYEYYTTVQGLSKADFHKYIIRNQYLTKIQAAQKTTIIESKIKAINQQQSNESYLYDLINAFLQINFVDFNKMYFYALSKYRIKEQFLYLSINRRYAFLTKYLQVNKDRFPLQNYLLKNVMNKQEKVMLKQATNKKILGLAYLQIVQIEANNLLSTVLGQSIMDVYSIDFKCNYPSQQ